jgi:hypothetical protein
MEKSEEERGKSRKGKQWRGREREGWRERTEKEGGNGVGDTHTQREECAYLRTAHLQHVSDSRALMVSSSSRDLTEYCLHSSGPKGRVGGNGEEERDGRGGREEEGDERREEKDGRECMECDRYEGGGGEGGEGEDRGGRISLFLLQIVLFHPSAYGGHQLAQTHQRLVLRKREKERERYR